MPKEYETNVTLSMEDAGKIKNWGERTFATACLKKGLTVRYQIPVGASVIDFQVINPKSADESGGLVEVTAETPAVLKKDDRKKRQEESMEKSGQHHTILNIFHLKKIRNSSNED